MEFASAILLLIIALWASLSAKAAAFENINKRRDIILTGKIGTDELSPDHLRLIYESDWRPLAWGTIITSALFGLAVALIPFLISDTFDRRLLAIACWLVAGYFVVAGVVTWINMRKEGRMLEAHLNRVAVDKNGKR
ncbi:hypothetical protein KW785_01895 [Candidatus Parcubacteria bacterium]|nr:hypothetical protein [Candidatus Parcubacteria bacterium]